MVAEAASFHAYSIEYDNEKIPTLSVNLSKEDTEGNVIMPITIHPDLFRMKKDNESIKTNITLPAPSASNEINFAAILKDFEMESATE